MIITARLVRRALLVLALIFAATPAFAADAPIDRQALVMRHNPTLTKVDRHAPLMLGNGDIGFTDDITGLQTFPEQYSEIAPLLTMAQWAWHTFPNPKGFTEESGLTNVPVAGRGEQPYAWMKSGTGSTDEHFVWLRSNPHRFSLARISLALQDGSELDFSKVTNIRQKGREIPFLPRLPQRVSSKRLAVFTRQFSVMLDAGLPLVQCLEILAEQEDSKVFASIIDKVRGDVEAGASLAEAMRKHPKAFDELYCSMIAAGSTGAVSCFFSMLLTSG